MTRSVGFEIKTLDNMISRKIMMETKQKDGCALSHVQVKVIHYLFDRQKEATYQKDIEKFLNVRRSTVSGILQTMEKNNFIQKISSEEDARLKQIVLTNKIIEAGKILKRKANYFDQLLSKNIAHEDLEIFFKVVDQMKENISK